MIVLENVTKTVEAFGKKRQVLSLASAQIPIDRHIAVVATKLEDTTVLVELIAGIELPASGRVIRKGRVSFPVGYQGGFDRELTVSFNVAHAARLYGADVKSIVNFVRDFSELGKKFDEPFNMLTTPERADIARIIAYSLPFDTYVHTSEITRLFKEGSQNKALTLFEMRARTCGMIIPARNFESARETCDMGLLLHRGKLHVFDDIDQATHAFQNIRGEKI